MKFNKHQELLMESVFFIIAATLLVTLYTNPLVLTALLLIALALALFIWYEENDIIFFLAGAFLGALGEIICVNLGVWHYAKPQVLGIPLWLPVGWGMATLLIMRVSKTLSPNKQP